MLASWIVMIIFLFSKKSSQVFLLWDLSITREGVMEYTNNIHSTAGKLAIFCDLSEVFSPKKSQMDYKELES